METILETYIWTETRDDRPFPPGSERRAMICYDPEREDWLREYPYYIKVFTVSGKWNVLSSSESRNTAREMFRHHASVQVPCEHCKGTGKIDDTPSMEATFLATFSWDPSRSDRERYIKPLTDPKFIQVASAT